MTEFNSGSICVVIIKFEFRNKRNVVVGNELNEYWFESRDEIYLVCETRFLATKIRNFSNQRKLMGTNIVEASCKRLRSLHNFIKKF